MKKSKKIMLFSLIILLIISSVLLFVGKTEKDVLQKNIDLVFTNAVSDSMGGLSMDYDKIDTEEKIRCYYQTLSNLHDALEVFHISSYKEYNELFQTLNRLYIYILKNKGENYEIDDKLSIFNFLGKVLVYPDDNQLISDFNSFLDSKSK
jgi:hypothetical protein